MYFRTSDKMKISDKLAISEIPATVCFGCKKALYNTIQCSIVTIDIVCTVLDVI